MRRITCWSSVPAFADSTTLHSWKQPIGKINTQENKKTHCCVNDVMLVCLLLGTPISCSVLAVRELLETVLNWLGQVMPTRWLEQSSSWCRTVIQVVLWNKNLLASPAAMKSELCLHQLETDTLRLYAPSLQNRPALGDLVCVSEACTTCSYGAWHKMT